MCPTSKMKIRVLTKQEDLIMDLIDRLPNLQEKKEYLHKLKDSPILTKKKETNIKEVKLTYNFLEIVDKFKLRNKLVTIQDLQIEINILKQELRELKSKNFTIKKINEQMIAQIINLNDRIDHKDKMNVDRPNLFLIDPSSSKTIIYRKTKKKTVKIIF